MLNHSKNVPEGKQYHLHGYDGAKKSWWISRSSKLTELYITRTFATFRANDAHDMCEQNQ